MSVFIESVCAFLLLKRLNVLELPVADVNIVDAFQFHKRATVCFTTQDVRHYICFLNKGILLWSRNSRDMHT